MPVWTERTHGATMEQQGRYPELRVIHVDKRHPFETDTVAVLKKTAPQAEIDRRQLPEELRLERIEPDPDGVFPRDKVEDRQKAVFHAIKAIWGQV